MNICYSVAYNGLVCFYYSDWVTSANRKYKYMGYSLKRAKQELNKLSAGTFREVLQ